MCKPTCCSSSNGSGLGAAIAALIGIVIICAIARPVIDAVEDILHIVLITLSVLAGIAIVTLVVLRLIRFCAGKCPVTHPAQLSTHGWHAKQVQPGIWSYRDPKFIYRKFELTQPSSGCPWCDTKIAEWLYGDDLELSVNDLKALNGRRS